jgi:hypothetical protein
MSNEPTKKPRLWVVTKYYNPEAVSAGQYFAKTADGRSDPLDLKVICGQPNHLSRSNQAPSREMRNGVEVFRVWSTLLNEKVVLGRAVNALTLGTAVFWKSLWTVRQGDKVLVATAPPNLPFTTALASLIKGASYTLLIHDFYPDQLVALGKLKPNSFPVRAMHFANAWLFKHSARIIVTVRDTAELVAARTESLDVQVSVIPIWAGPPVVPTADHS